MVNELHQWFRTPIQNLVCCHYVDLVRISSDENMQHQRQFFVFEEPRTRNVSYQVTGQRSGTQFMQLEPTTKGMGCGQFQKKGQMSSS